MQLDELLYDLKRRGVKLRAKNSSLECFVPLGMNIHDLHEHVAKYKMDLIGLLGEITVAREIPNVVYRSFPLSTSQSGLYLLQSLHPESTAYNIPLWLKVNSELNEGYMDLAWEWLQRQFPILTTKFHMEESQLLQCQSMEGLSNIEWFSRTSEIEADAHVSELFRKPFQIDGGRLARFYGFRLESGHYYFFINVHHSILDGVSIVVLLNHLFGFYRQLVESKQITLSNEKGNIADYVVWEGDFLSTPMAKKQAAYWQSIAKQLDSPAYVLPDISPNFTQSLEGAYVTHSLSPESVGQLRKQAQIMDCNMSVLILSAYAFTLMHYTNRQDLAVGVPVMGRSAPEFRQEIGNFINIIPLVLHVDESKDFQRLANHVQSIMMDGIFHGQYPLANIANDLGFQGRDQHLFHLAFSFQDYIPAKDLPSLPMQERLEIQRIDRLLQSGEFEFCLEVMEREKDISLHLKYDKNLYSSELVQQFLAHLTSVLESLERNAGHPLGSQPLVSSHDQTQFNDDESDNGDAVNSLLHELVLTQCELHGEKIAVRSPSISLSYRELSKESEKIALQLQKLGVGVGDFVGVCMKRDPHMIIALLGVLRAGAAYVPIDPEFPEDRVKFMINDSNLRAVLSETAFIEMFAEENNNSCRWLDVHNMLGAKDVRSFQLVENVTPSDLAYMIYTSGSTGRPKGVMVEHRNISNFLVSMAAEPGFQNDDCMLALTTLSFDIAALELFLPIMCGGEVFICPADIVRDGLAINALIDEVQPTVMQATPATWQMLISCGWKNTQKTKVLCGGEALPPSLKAAFDNIETSVWNLYGPTETTVWSSVAYLSRGDVIHLGQPIANTQLMVLNEQLQRVPTGVPGELHISGAGVARGYYQREQLTNERFVENPFQKGQRIYKTGDLVRQLPNGKLEYLGRKDAQLKIHGYRIEPAEIETRLNQHTDVLNSAVVACEDDIGKRLVAYYESYHGRTLPEEWLRQHLHTSLPSYMVPAVIVHLESLPLTPNGKIDKKSLANSSLMITSKNDYVAPSTDTEEAVIVIAADLLQREIHDISVLDNFFSLGGHSLHATQFVANIHERFKVSLPIKTFFDVKNFSELAEMIALMDLLENDQIDDVNEESEFEEIAL